MSTSHSGKRVLIAGGGVAALEAMLAVRDLTDGQAEVTLLSPEREFTYKPLLVIEPFGPDTATRHDLPALAAELGADFIEDRLLGVDPVAGTASTGDSRDLRFDYAVIAIGARMQEALSPAHTLWVERIPTSIETLLDRATDSGGLDLIVPPGVTWSLPLYEFALMAERRARERAEPPPIRIVTPEPAPLAIFGPAASAEIAELLAARRISITTGTWISEGPGGELRGSGDGSELSGYPVALPILAGIPIEGLPSDEHGFIPIDRDTRVRGCDRVFAVGDGTDFPVKQGGLATQQADTAAAQIAFRMEAAPAPEPLRPVLRGKLLTGAESLHMRTAITGGAGDGVVSSDYLWWPPHKVSGRYLAPWLAAAGVQGDPTPPGRSIDIELPLEGEWPAA